MIWKDRTIKAIAEMIAVHPNHPAPHFVYRSSSRLTRFFEEAGTDHVHDGTTRGDWTADTLRKILEEPHTDDLTPPDAFCRVIARLMDQAEAQDEPEERPAALKALNLALGREGFEAFYAEDKQCYIRHVGTQRIAGISTNPHRPLSTLEAVRRLQLAAYLDKCSEDDLIGEVLMPLFKHAGFHRITVAGHKDKSNEFGKDIWMRYQLPTQHYIYFGIQAKKGKLDASGVTRGSNANMAEIHNQALMMLGHEIFDPETNRKVLVDHAFIVAGGEITKAAQQWLAGKLDASKRSQIIFMDREDILNLYVVRNVPLPADALPKAASDLDDDLPF
ncbi:hypothetical protein [Acetobacter thailandicus]|uniref:Restriction endonuclease n=1 Tax=Acetobacter thailandicus TaxID=1502842 RepID=A0ABT3QCI6_9PROT|nr:hypothetical protein [Acetobacter thailandicus]MCX2563019.1 hypothetical protein [Acetobacter thailandicus]NHN96155.1 hypothetical protein [Acetobacter thailandicus]